MVSDRIKLLRKQKNITQSELARKLNLTRSSINAWEQGISIPSTTAIVELADIFGTTTDYLLGRNENNAVDTSGLSEEDITLLNHLATRLKEKQVFFTVKRNSRKN